jgi:hypothetical protein
MAVRGDEVAGSIDAQIREAIQKLVAEMRSSIEDVREAVDQQLQAALQSIQADVNSVSFLPQIQKSIAQLDQPPPAPAAPPPGMAGSSRVKSALQNIERGKSQVDVLNGLLEQCVQFGSRAALLILKGETFSGWKGVGFGAHGGSDENIKRFNAAPGLIPELDRLLRDERVVQWNGANLASRFGVTGAKKAVLVPMVIKDKVSAAVYIDCVAADEAKFDPTSLEILVFTTGLLVDTLSIRKKIPSPSLTEEAGAAGAQPAAASPLPPFQTPAPAAPRPAPAAPPRPAAPAAAPRPAAPQPVASPPHASATVSFSAAQVREAAAAAPMPKPTFHGEEAAEGRPSTQYVPPSAASRPAPSHAPGTEDAKKHDEARRFARLLVSEIKLYNEAKVEQGRKNRDLYERLKEDIDRSRQMYDERIGEDVRKSSNYFYDELVRILADGKAEALGL